MWVNVVRPVGERRLSLSLLPSSPKRSQLGIPWWSSSLGLHAFTVEGLGSIPGPGTKIPQGTWCGLNNNNNKTPMDGQGNGSHDKEKAAEILEPRGQEIWTGVDMWGLAEMKHMAKLPVALTSH